MIKEFKNLQIGDRCYVRNKEGEFLKIQITKKENGKFRFGYLESLHLYDDFMIRHPTFTADPDKLISVYSHADSLPANPTANPL